MQLNQIDHVAIAVRDLDAEVQKYSDTLRLTLDHYETVESEGITEAMFKVGESYIQLISPTNDRSTVHRFLERHGEGIHHIAYRVSDCARAISQLKAEGVRMIDETPRSGSRGTKIAFIHPSSFGGTLIELVELQVQAQADTQAQGDTETQADTQTQGDTQAQAQTQ